MATETLTTEQLAFLEECSLEFSDRYTDADLDYKRIYDLGIPPPPIMSPWYGRNRNRDRGNGGQYGNRTEDYHNRGQGGGYHRHKRPYDNDRNYGHDNYNRDRFRPY